jgi:hypothetical protein
MNVTGFTKRSLAERDEITFLFFGSLSSVTGSGVFGFSGDGGSDRFLFKEGKIYDPENRYFSSYQAGENFSISGNISGAKYNYYYNEEPVVFVGEGSAGKIGSFYLDATGCEIDTDIKIKSKTFAYTLAFPQSYRAGEIVTGYISGQDSNYNFKIFSGEVTSPDYWTLNGFDTGDLNYANVKISNTGTTSGINAYPHNVNLILYTNLGNIERNISIVSTSSNSEAGTLFSIEDMTTSSGESDFLYTGGFYATNKGTASLAYEIYSEEVEFVGNKPIKISLDDVNTSGSLNGYTLTGVQLQGSYKNGLYTGLPVVTFSSTGAKDVQATATALMGEYMCADLYTGGPSATPLWDLDVKFHTVTGIQLDTSGAYEDSTSISISFSGGQYRSAGYVGGYWYNGPSSENNLDPTCTGLTPYWYSSGTYGAYDNVINSHIKQHASNAVALTTTGNVFSRSVIDTWNILTGEFTTGDSSLISFNDGEPWSSFISTGEFTGVTITEADKTLGNSYYDSGVTQKNSIKIEVWNQSAYRPISNSGARIITEDNFYTYNYNPITVYTAGNRQWGELKDLTTGALLTGGTGEVTFTYSFIESGTTRDNFYTIFKTLEDTGNGVTFSQFTGEVGDAFGEWKGLFETVFTGLTVNFINNGLETGKVVWSDRSTTQYALPHVSDSKIGDIRIGKVLQGEVGSPPALSRISTALESHSGNLLGQSGNAGGDITINSYNTKYRLDSDTTSTADSYSIKYLFCQQIGSVLGVYDNDHQDSILHGPANGNAKLYTTYSFSDYFTSLSASRADQDAVRYSYAGTGHSTLESSKSKISSTTDSYSATLNISGSGSQSISQTITGGAI